ncbi:hypothetical protein K3555_06715 [Leisingera sp. M527]|uniref:hypothetical protein n=1 Tax=Leisingera sp. M527 TaxID=2867014 RepID=UPI0021A83255|nr:hypothetical protein [Leisingera sp. M527]UWQ34184.1 hypothetical protein K3555_06715 [Leisingera sp. M527]
MDLPPWIKEPENSHPDRILAIADCIYRLHYKKVIHLTNGPMLIFDNLCAGPLQLAAEVLHQSGFTEFQDAIQRMSVFTCSPSEFKSLANSAQAQKVSLERVKTAVIRLSDEGFGATGEIACLAEKLQKNQ